MTNVHTLNGVVNAHTMLELAKKNDYGTLMIIGLTPDQTPVIMLGGDEPSYSDMQWLSYFLQQQVHLMGYEGYEVDSIQ